MTRLRHPLPFSARRGAVLIYLVVVLLFTSVIAVSVISLSTSATETDVSSAASTRAQFLARSAVEYAQWEYCYEGGVWASPLTLTFADGETATVDLAGGIFTATATTFAGTRLEARAQASATALECVVPPVSIFGDSPDDYVIYTGGTGGTYALPSGSTVDGSVFGPTVSINAANVGITGNIVSLNSVTLGSGAEIGGYVCAGGNVTLNSANTLVTGDIISQGNVTISSGTSVLGSIYATGTVTLSSGSALVGGDIHAGGNVTMGSGARVNGSVHTSGSLTMQSSNARIDGEAHVGTSFESTRGTVVGQLVAGFNVTMINGARVENNVRAGNNLIFGSGQAKVITGNSQAGGNRNDHTPANVFMSVPAPTAPDPPDGCPPTPPAPLQQTFTANNNHISVPQSTSQTIVPGTYGNLTLGGGTTTTLQAGAPYIFQSFGPGIWGQTLRLDLSTGSRITVFVEGAISFSGRVEVSTDGVNYTRVSSMDTDTAKLLAKRVYWETPTSFTITTGNGVREWFGTVLSGGNVSLAANFYVAGAVATINGTITSGANQTVIFSIADFAAENWNP